MERNKSAKPDKNDKEDKWERQFRQEKNKYCKIEVVGHGAYGCVYKAHKNGNRDKLYAIKKIKHKKTYGFSITSLREIKLLKSIKHKNIVRIKEIKTSRGKLIRISLE